MHDLDGLAQRQAQLCKGSKKEWYDALVECVACNECLKLYQDNFLLLLENAKTPEALADFFRFWCDQCTDALDQTHALFTKFIELVDESTFSLGDWLEAISVLYRWLKAKHYRAEVLTALGYINCCAEGGGRALGQANLPWQVQEALETFGFNKAIEA